MDDLISSFKKLDVDDLVSSFEKLGFKKQQLKLKVNINIKDTPLWHIDFSKILEIKNLTELEYKTIISFVIIDLLIKRYPFLKDANILDIEANTEFFLYGDFLLYGDYPDTYHRVYQYSKDVINDATRVFWLYVLTKYISDNKIVVDDNVIQNINENVMYFKMFPKNHSFQKIVKLLS